MNHFFAPISAYFVSVQCKRDLSCCVILVLAVLGYLHYVSEYLRTSAHPGALWTAFIGSLVFSLWHDFKKGDWRGSLLRITATALVFLVAASLAPTMREMYFNLMDNARSIPEVVAMFDAEVLILGSNRLIGYGTGMAMGLCVVRLAGYWVATKGLYWLLGPSSLPRCPHCKETLPV